MQLPITTENDKFLIVDLCHTLVMSNTTFDFFNFFFEYEKIAPYNRIRKNFILKLFNALLFRVTGIDILRKLLVRMLEGIPVKDVENAVKVFVNTCSTIDRVSDLVKEYRNKGYQIVVVSASLDFIVRAFAEKFEFEHNVGTKLAVENGIFTGKISSDLLGNKHLFIPNISFHLITDNLSDIALAKKAIFSTFVCYSEKQKKFWGEHLSKSYGIIELYNKGETC